ncbi:peptide-binding protein [Desulfoplanes formicivorans]|uniref:Peptide-binding protein n=1 Tax=Desulfoplanes formicivorans TaxID=1592317 RepID=A0A194AFY3_9BACT|nr:peptide-binding protein [Desulfoplanes formicivorans]
MRDICLVWPVIIVCLLMGCDSFESPPSISHGQHVAMAMDEIADEQAVPGGRIVLGSIGEPSNLIPPLASDGASHELAEYLYVALLRYNKNIELEPWAARSYEVLDGGQRLRFTLRDDIRWFDGQPLTTEDVEFTYKLMIDPETPTAYAENFKAIKSFNLIDKYTFEVTYDRPFARALLTWASLILPKHVLEKENLLDTPYSRNPMGAGPYRLKEWEPGRRIVLEANEDYFEGRPNIDTVVYRFIPDTTTMFMELKSGNLDMMNLSPQQYLYQTKGPLWEQGFAKYTYLSFSYAYLGYNLQRPLFADVRVRRAIAHAIDKEEIVKGVLLGQGQSTIGPYKPGTWVYNTSIRDYVHDPERARALLAQAGWKDRDGDGWLDKDGHAFRFTILTNQGNNLRIKAATIIQYRLKQIGIDVRIRTVEWATFIKEFVDKGRFDALILGWNILQDPDIYNVWHSSKAVPGGLNFVGYKNKELDALLDKGRRLMDPRERKPVYDRIQEILHRDQPYCFLYVPMSLPIVQKRFRGIEPAPAGITYNFNDWWIPKTLQLTR